MSHTLSSRLGSLTKAINRLNASLDHYSSEVSTQLVIPDEESRRMELVITRKDALKEAISIITKHRDSVQAALENYTAAADSCEERTKTPEKLKQDTKTTIDKALEQLDKAEDYLSQLMTIQIKLENASSKDNSCSTQEKIGLPPIPISKFNGRVWEWEAFWGAFNHTIHSKNIDDITKMNYLLDALQGEAKEFIKHYEVSQESYQIAISHLREKYGNGQAIISQLLHRLRTTQLHGNTLSDEEQLCEILYSIVIQLQQKGECIDSSLLQQQILGKFTKETQRRVLQQKQLQWKERTWGTEEMLTSIRQHIRQELEIEHQIGRSQESIKECCNKVHASQFTQLKSRENLACLYCGRANHKSIDCRTLESNEKRVSFFKEHGLCLNCGSSKHRLSACKAGPCRICNKRGHHTSLCRDREILKEQKVTNNKEGKHPDTSQYKKSKSSVVNTIELDTKQNEQSLILQTKTGQASGAQILAGQALIFNHNEDKKEIVQIILDTGSDHSFITKRLASHLELEDEDCIVLTIQAFETKPKKKECGVATLKLQDAYGQKHDITVMKVDNITPPLKRCKLDQVDRDFLDHHNVKLSINPDSSMIKPELLLGCQDSLNLLDDRSKMNITLPSGIKLITSRLGYLVTGGHSRHMDTPDESTQTKTTVIERKSEHETRTTKPLDAQEFMGPEQQERELQNDVIWQQFQTTIQKREDGYYVRLPWKSNASTLPDNKSMAVKRLQSMLARLEETPEVLNKYHKTIEEQLEQGIIERVNETRSHEEGIIHYLPHQPVFTPNKETTKLRIVYDASAHLKVAPSLNDVLHQGPTLLPQITDIMLRFRIGDVALISDVEKAFLQVRLQEKDRDATRFLWMKDVTQPCSKSNSITYRFTRVPFGLTCSPFLLAATIKHHLSNYTSNTTLAKNLMGNTYVDNVIITVKSTEEGINTYKNMKKTFNDMQMNLRSFLSNNKDLMHKLPERDTSANSTQKVLGITWCSDEDTLALSCEYPVTRSLTKRSVAEQIATIYDPMGWLSPLTLKGKLFLQNLWNFDYKWDAPLSQEHVNQWRKLVEEVNGFKIRIPRRITQIATTANLVLFADASKQCMATCAYLVSKHNAQLLMARTKLSTVKSNPTIPKLELNALTMAVRLAQSISRALKGHTPLGQITILSDSEIALCWLRPNKTERTNGTMVRNRVQEIRRIVKELEIQVQFGYVTTDQNAADCATRGLKKTELINHKWWVGPKFIREPLSQNHSRLFTLVQENNQNGKIGTVFQINVFTTEELLDWKRFNQILPAQRTTAYVLRFISKLLRNVRDELRRRIQKNIPEICSTSSEPFITAQEYEMALRVLVRNHQNTHYPNYSSKLVINLSIYQDNHGTLRCKGRIGNADIPFETQEPMLVIPNTPLAEVLVNEAHLPFHCSTSQTIANVRRRFWIPCLRRMARKAVRKCLQCQKMNNLPYKYPDMDNLPPVRVRRTRPFEHVGLDCFGPLATKKNDEIPTKAYGIIITCTTTRLLHLELVPDMSTKGLILALRKFFARRGIPSTITSDNSPTFLLTDQIFKDEILKITNDTSLTKTMATRGIEWRTITPFAPWQGAFYERLIKSVKHSLYKTIQNKAITIEELETILIEIEGMLNNRPLTYQEEEPDNLHILRPIDFIQQDIILTYPFENIEDQDDDEIYLPSHEATQIRTRQEVIQALKSSQKIIEHYWTIWSQQYLTSLRETHKFHMDQGRFSSLTPSEGTIVLVADPVLPRNTWKVARIIKLHTTTNGTIREAHLKLSNRRTIRRPVNLLIPLEIGEITKQQQPDIQRNTEVPQDQYPRHQYNLRPRKKKTIVSDDHFDSSRNMKEN